jgi:hypothetical protein
VVPKVSELNGADPIAYIVSSNERRNITRGQKAMFYVGAEEIAAKELSKGGRGKTVLRQNGFSKSRASYARLVREQLPKLVPEILAGTLPLDDAYRQGRAKARSRGVMCW